MLRVASDKQHAPHYLITLGPAVKPPCEVKTVTRWLAQCGAVSMKATPLRPP